MLKSNSKITYIVGAVLLFVGSFMVFILFRGNVPFMDEMDNFANGVQMAKGSTLYVDIFSQHMPLMYYICMLMSMVGIDTILEFRLAWYVLLAILYVAVYLRYSAFYGRFAMILWPIIYLFSLSQVFLATSILAEQLQAVGMVILLLEFLRFDNDKKMDIGGAVFIAVAINISFLSAFVSAFAIAVIVLGFILREVSLAVVGRFGTLNAVKAVSKKYALTIALTLAPMIALALYYLIIGTFDDFFYRAITFNMTVYSDYQSGFGSSPISAIVGTLGHYIDFIKQCIQTLFQGADLLTGGVVFLNFAFWGYLLILLLKRRIYALFVVGAFFLMCGTRGFFNFHALQTFSLTAVMMSLIIGELTAKTLAAKSLVKRAVFSVGVGVILVVYFAVSGDVITQRADNLIIHPDEFETEYEAHSNETLINTLTEPNEYILQNVNNEHLFLSTHAKMAPYHTGMSPWWWEATRERSMEMLIENPPNVAIFDPEYMAFDYLVKDFAPELTDFVADNYTIIYEDAPYFYVHNNFYEQAISMLPTDDEDMLGTIHPDTTCGEALESGAVQQSFTASREIINTISVQFGTHSQPYNGEVEVKLTDSNDAVIYGAIIDGRKIKDNNFTHLLQDEAIPVQIGEAYTITLDITESNDKNLTIWADPTTPTQHKAVTHEGEQSYSLRIKIR